jgi:hypothetical protein
MMSESVAMMSVKQALEFFLIAAIPHFEMGIVRIALRVAFLSKAG